MKAAECVVTSAGDLVRQFSHYSDIALGQPVVITRNGRPRNVLISVEEYERLKKRDQQAFLAVDTPEHFIEDIVALAGSEDN
ncbi:MAG: type II toxin-antitoxin system prevent-host-death family antitoxin [Azospirillaceae bacterium]|nr:type II toxin-antitoxin system prevent-host-death family antitoxin [Azospirillaceae bacterium]